MVGFSIVALLLVLFLAVESRPAAGTRMDWLGAFYIVVAVGATLTALNEAATLASAFSVNTLLLVIGLTAVSAGAFVAFWSVEKRGEQPMVQIVHLRLRSTWAPLLTTTLAMTGIFAVVNGIVPAYVQAAAPGFAINPTQMALIILTPYALFGWLVGPLSGRLAPTLGYTKMLRIGLLGSALALAVIGFGGLNSLPLMILGAVLLGILYAGVANIMLNGLGVVLSPPGNPGFLPGMNAGAFNLGAGLSFLVLPSTLAVLSTSEDMHTSYCVVIGVGFVLTLASLGTSFLIPKPVGAEIQS